MPNKMDGTILVEVVSYMVNPTSQNSRMIEQLNGGKVPQVLTVGMTTAEWWKITPNPNQKMERPHFHIQGVSPCMAHPRFSYVHYR